MLFLAGGAAAVFLRPAGLPYGARFKELSLQNAGFALKELFVHIASKTFLGSLIQSTTPGSAPKPSVSGSTPAPPVRLAGTYRVEGANPDGTRYSGTATISPSGDRLLMTWVVSNRVFTGTGTFSGQALTIYWSDSGGRTGVMVYTLTQGGGPDGIVGRRQGHRNVDSRTIGPPLPVHPSGRTGLPPVPAGCGVPSGPLRFPMPARTLRRAASPEGPKGSARHESCLYHSREGYGRLFCGSMSARKDPALETPQVSIHIRDTSRRGLPCEPPQFARPGRGRSWK